MTHSRYLRNMARLLRVERELSVDQLATRLALPRSTVYYWVRDLPLHSEGRRGEAGRASARAGVGDAPGEVERLRPGQASAYEEGLRSFGDLTAQPTFREFVCLYAAEGYKRGRTHVALANADPAIMRLASRWIWRLTDRSPSLSICCSDGQSLNELRGFWSEAVNQAPATIAPGSDADDAPLHAWGAPALHGVLTVSVDDKLLRARLQAWMCRLREGWR
jgi:hypothetical protein